LQHLPEKCNFIPYENALLAAARQREVITPELLAAVERAAADPAGYPKDDYLHLFAIYLLAQFREPRALDVFLRFLSLPGEQAFDLTGDLITENGAAILASVCGGDPAPLQRLIHDETANEFVRGQAIAGLLVQSLWGERPREAVIADLRSLFSTLPRPGDAYVWAELVSAVADFNALELLPEVRRAYAEDLADESLIGLDDIDPEQVREPDGYKRPSPEQQYNWFCERHPPIDTVAECAGWICFREEPNETDDWDAPEDDWDSTEEIVNGLLGTPTYELPLAPFVAPPKVGRNDPCPCGSGKKFKKCCGK
jgi:hypothetical protein